MPFKELFHFDEEAYKTKVHAYGKAGVYEELAKRKVLKRRRIYSTKVKIGCCGVLLLPTGGGSGFGLFIGLRQRSVAKKKYEHVKAAMHANNMPLPQPKKRDKLVPIAINVFVYTLTLGLLIGLEEIGAIAANEVAEYGLQGSANLIDPTPVGEAGQAVSNPGDFVQGMLHGAHTQVSELHGLLNPNETMVEHAVAHNLDQPIAEHTAGYFSGETAGAQLAPVVERLTAVTVAAEVLDRIADSSVTYTVNRKAVASPKGGVVITEVPLGVEKTFAVQ